MLGDFAREDVVSVATRVMVGSAERSFVSLDWAGSTSPASPVGSGVYHRSGTVTFQHRRAVVVRPELPFARTGGWPPERGHRLQVWYDVTLTDGRTVAVQRFHGRVDDVRMGDLVEVDFVEDWDSYRTDVSVDPMMRVMPGGRRPNGFAASRYQARIEPIGPVYRALEQAGLGILPRPVHPSGARVLVHASWQGATVPTVGGVESMGAVHITPDMLWYLDDVTVREPFTFGTPAGEGTDSIAVWIRASREAWDTQRQDPTLTLTGGGNTVLARLTPTGMTLTLNGSAVATVPVAYAPSDPIGIALHWSSGTVRVYETGTQSEQIVSAALPPPTLPYAEVRGRWLAGFRVTRGESATTWSRAALSLQHDPVEFVRPFWGGGLDASRLIEARTAEEVLTEYADRQLAYVWQDEVGRLRIWGADALHAQAPARTYTEHDLLSEVMWSEAWQTVRSAVTVEYLRAAITNSASWTTVLWQGSSAKRLMNGDSDQTIAEPTDHEDWIEPDFTVDAAVVGSTDFENGIGSWWSAVRTDNGSWPYAYTTFNLEPIPGSVTKALITHSVSGLPSGAIELRVPDDPEVPPSWRDRAMPMLRGRGRITWTDATTTPATTGATWAPQYVHEMSWWGRPADADRARDWLAPRLTAPTPVLSALQIRVDPQLQRGDVIRLDLTKSQGVTVTALVEDIAESVSHGDHSMTIAVRVIATSTPAPTYAAFEREQGSTTYTEFQTRQGSTTYTEFQTQQSGG